MRSLIWRLIGPMVRELVIAEIGRINAERRSREHGIDGWRM